MIRKTRRGMVTAEIGVGMVAVVLLVAMVAGLAATAQMQARCLATASEVARFEIRDDSAGADRAVAQAPVGAVVTRTRNGPVIVVIVRAPVSLAGLPEFWVEAKVETVKEPDR